MIELRRREPVFRRKDFFLGDEIPNHDRTGKPIEGRSFVLLFNAHSEGLTFTIPEQLNGTWRIAIASGGQRRTFRQLEGYTRSVCVTRILMCMPNETVMVRARVATRDKLARMSKEQGITAVEMLDRLVSEHEEAEILQRYANISSEDVAALTAEQPVWDGTLGDDLVDEDFSWVRTEG